ncbi:MAG TPA: gliding motility-associated C-terminal domain-containing protein [Puia sp.]|jgi:gliding motility-associated-like protein
MKYFFPALLLLFGSPLFAQTQACPLNSDFSLGNLTHWAAYTGNNARGNPAPASDELPYDSTKAAPVGTIGNSQIYEYNLPSVLGIQILTTPSTDAFGSFSTIPKINGYQYTSSVLLGSTSISRSSASGTSGGYVRGISYAINVPPGSPSEPYTMTYAYAMVLENGTHNSAQQPLFSATLSVNDSIITCASPKYFLPTEGNAGNSGTGALLDSALARSQGFYLSNRPSPNSNPNSTSPNAGHLQDVWAKDWTEVTFDLSPFRGRQVTLTFETDNCVPGGHFAYSYIALRNVCAGLQISGFSIACTNSVLTYSIPGLTGATYRWGVPADWTIVGGTDSSVLKVKVGSLAGSVVAEELNSCADLKDTLDVSTTLPTVAGAVSNDAEVCAGSNTSALTLSGYTGGVLSWLASTDNGGTWSPVADTTRFYTAQDLSATTEYVALVQNSASCEIDTSTGSKILVDPLSVGGKLSPSTMEFCIGQNKDALLVLTGATGNPVNWQSSPDGVAWTGFTPNYTQVDYSLLGLTTPTQYRVIVKSGVCPADTSEPANINIIKTLFPQATAEPLDTAICYGTKATLNTTISIGTSYTWSNTNTLANYGDGNVNTTPYSIQTLASPLRTNSYIFTVENAGCPNALIDTFLVRVIPPIIVDAGNDTSIVINQPLQLHASSNDTTAGGDTFSWTPVIGLNDPNIPDPIATLSAETDSIRYIVKAMSAYGCYGLASIVVRVFKTLPDIFVPNAFTPGGATNNLFRPIPVGISTLQYFRVYNRYGQLVYATSAMGEGWDGRIGGRLVDSGTFVWMVQGKTYTGKTIFHKGTMVLVR